MSAASVASERKKVQTLPPPLFLPTLEDNKHVFLFPRSVCDPSHSHSHSRQSLPLACLPLLFAIILLSAPRKGAENLDSTSKTGVKMLLKPLTRPLISHSSNCYVTLANRRCESTAYFAKERSISIIRVTNICEYSPHIPWRRWAGATATAGGRTYVLGSGPKNEKCHRNFL